MIADVISIYTEDVAPKQARPKEVAARLGKLLDFFGTKRLSELNAKLCGKYVEWRGHEPAARRELEDLRAAVRHHWKEGLCIAETPVVLPQRGEPRPTWLRKSEAARLLLAAYQYREVQKGLPPAGARFATSHASSWWASTPARALVPSAAPPWTRPRAKAGWI